MRPGAPRSRMMCHTTHGTRCDTHCLMGMTARWPGIGSPRSGFGGSGTACCLAAASALVMGWYMMAFSANSRNVALCRHQHAIAADVDQLRQRITGNAALVSIALPTIAVAADLYTSEARVAQGSPVSIHGEERVLCCKLCLGAHYMCRACAHAQPLS